MIHVRLKVFRFIVSRDGIFRCIAFLIFKEGMKKRPFNTPKNRKTDLQIAFGAAVRSRRMEAGLSQERLADIADLHFTYVSSVERGERNISLENIGKLSRALNCEIAELVASLKV